MARGIGNERIDRLFAEIGACLADCDTMHVRRRICELQNALSHLDAVRAQGRSGGRGDTVSLAIALMEDNIQTPLTIDELADACGTPPSTLKKRFGATMGQPIFRWYRSLRLERARAMLAETDLTVAQVAASVGYANPSKFSHAFLEETGLTPSDWRASFPRV